MTYFISAKNSIEARLLAKRKFIGGDRQISALGQVTTLKPVFRCICENGQISVERV